MSYSLEELHSEAFNRETYTSVPLGIHYTPQETSFALWTPTAEAVELLLYPAGALTQRYPMRRKEDARFVFEKTVPQDLWGIPYQYEVHQANGTVSLSNDPYAVASTANSAQSVVLDPSLLNPPGFEDSRLKAMPEWTDIAIYEAHIRDLTIGPFNGIRQKGTYLGLTEEGTKTPSGKPTGLDYLKKTGITHLQLLPVFDYAGVDESSPLGFDTQYNWGYNPLNYNVPEGSYATDPQDPARRIYDLKKLIQTLHDNGIRVIMDVVYNHVYQVENSPFERTVPGYFFRHESNGSLSNGTGVGNEVASEQWMMRRYILDSLRYWVKEYHFDGFRFDLMGILDGDTLLAVREVLDEIDPGIILLGEGWVMGRHPEGTWPADLNHAKQLPRICFFDPSYRDWLRGSPFHRQDIGLLDGTGTHQGTLLEQWLGFCSSQGDNSPWIQGIQSVPYSECHDNPTLSDKLIMALGQSEIPTLSSLSARVRFALTMQALSPGLFFIHAGEELCRSKQGEENSYCSPDHINCFPYDNQDDLPDAPVFLAELIRLRKLCWPLVKRQEANPTETRSNLILESDPRRGVLTFTDGDSLYTLRVNASGEDWICGDLPAAQEVVLYQEGHFVEEAAIKSQAPWCVKAFSITLSKTSGVYQPR